MQPAEYSAHRLMAYVGRNIPIEAIRFATFNQAIDELRHAQIEIKHYAHMSKKLMVFIIVPIRRKIYGLIR